MLISNNNLIELLVTKIDECNKSNINLMMNMKATMQLCKKSQEEFVIRDQPIMLILPITLCSGPVLKFLTYYAAHDHVKDLCLKFGCFIKVHTHTS